jgi:ABC-2 type transport system ATP-binding protein
LSGFDCAIPPGKVTALVGPNGAGKTTLLLILAGLLAPDGGKATVGGFDPVVDPYEVHRVVGWMPDFFGVYEGLTCGEYIELFAAAYGLPSAAHNSRMRELMSLVGLETFIDRPVHTLSRGQKQRLGFARTIVHSPRILLLDEPASGLDPRARIELRELVRAQAAEGVAVLVSSHILTELEEMADIVAFADAGRCRGVFPVRDLPNSTATRTYRLRALDQQALLAALKTAGVDASSLADQVVVTVAGNEAAADLIAELVAGGVRLTEATVHGGGLEGAFMAMDEEIR